MTRLSLSLPAVSASGLVEETRDLRVETLPLADEADAHAAAMQFGEVAANEELEKPHQVEDLGLRPRPVLGGERIDRQPVDPQVGRGPDRLAERLDARLVTGEAGKAPLPSPIGRFRP